MNTTLFFITISIYTSAITLHPRTRESCFVKKHREVLSSSMIRNTPNFNLFWWDGMLVPSPTIYPHLGTVAQSGLGFCNRLCTRKLWFRIFRSRILRWRWSRLCWFLDKDTAVLLWRKIENFKIRKIKNNTELTVNCT